MSTSFTGDAMIQEDDQVKWASSEGGPLLLLPTELLRCWEGTDPPSNGRIVEADFRWRNSNDPATDYDLACDVEDWAGLIKVGHGQGLIFSGDVTNATWWPLSDGGLLVRPLYSDQEDDAENAPEFKSEQRWLEAKLSRIDMAIWEPKELTFRFERGPLYVFDSAYLGIWVLENSKHIGLYPLQIYLPSGKYAVRTGEYQPDENTSFILHKFSLQSL